MNEGLNYQSAEPIILGSGELYIAKASDISSPTELTPEDEAKLINIGAISSGASITISKEQTEVFGKNRGLISKMVKSTSVTFKTGVISFILKNIASFIYGVDYTVNATTGINKMIIGDENSPVVYLRFIHTDKETGKQLIVNIFRSVFSGNQEFAFDNEDATAINYEFAGLAAPIGAGNKNCYVEFIEYDPSVATGA